MVKTLLTVVFSLLIAGCAGSPLSNAVSGKGFKCTMDACVEQQPHRDVDWAGYVCIANKCDARVQPTTRPTNVSGAVAWVAYRQHYLSCNDVVATISHPVPERWGLKPPASYLQAVQIAERINIDVNDVQRHPFLQHKIRVECANDQQRYAEVLRSCEGLIETSTADANRILARYGMPQLSNVDLIDAILSPYVPIAVSVNVPHSAQVSMKVSNCRVSLTMN